MPKKSKAPKRAGGEQPGPRRSKRDKRQALPATELAAPAVKRCGQDTCKVCNPQACNDCSGCRRATKNGWDPAKQCEVAKNQRVQPCPNVEKARPKHARDPRNNDESSELYRASREIIARADDPSTASESQLVAVRALRAELQGRGADLSRWPPMLLEVKPLDRAYSVDEIISLDGGKAVLEAMYRQRYCKGGGLPSEAEADAMGPIEVAIAKRSQGHKAGWKHGTVDDGVANLAAHSALPSQKEEAWESFTSFIEGGTANAKRKGETWEGFWKRWSRWLGGAKKIGSHRGAAKRFYRQLKGLKFESRGFASTPEAIAWLKARDCIDEFMPRRLRAEDEELDWQGCYFRQDRKLWRVLETDGVVYDPKFEFPSGHLGSLVVAYYDVGKFGDAAPGDAAHEDVEVSSLDVFASFFEDGGGAEWD